MHVSFRKPFVWHPDDLQKHFRTPCTLFVILKMPPNPSKIGKNKPTTILDKVLRRAWTKFWLNKNPSLGPSFDSLSLYISIFYVCLSICLSIYPSRNSVFIDQAFPMWGSVPLGANSECPDPSGNWLDLRFQSCVNRQCHIVVHSSSVS